jgi:uncharacterized phage protein (TIGR01671 family)
MREIKFRAWDQTIKKMHSPEDFAFFVGSKNGLPYNGNLDAYDDFVLMQFTDLHDKNGKEIYEGDVVRQNGHDPDYVIEAVTGGLVVVASEELDSEVRLSESATADNQTMGFLESCEVIGDIYQNANLLTSN